MLKIGIIGFGYWGPNLVRNFTNQLEAIVVMVADGRNERLQVLKKNYPNIDAVQSAEDILKNPNIDAVVIATEVFSHYKLAKEALLNGKHVLLEKPMTS
jgi:predicted dehydrogenase